MMLFVISKLQMRKLLHKSEKAKNLFNQILQNSKIRLQPVIHTAKQFQEDIQYAVLKEKENIVPSHKRTL